MCGGCCGSRRIAPPSSWWGNPAAFKSARIIFPVLRHPPPGVRRLNSGSSVPNLELERELERGRS